MALTSPARMLARLREAVAASVAAHGGDPNVYLPEELLANRRADAALEQERDAALGETQVQRLSRVMSRQDFIAQLRELDRRADWGDHGPTEQPPRAST